MNAALFSILIDPETGQPLQAGPSGDALVNPSGQGRYPIINNVPVMLPYRAAPAEAFDYAAHYQVDAEAFDYFAAHEQADARHENRRLREVIIRQVPPGVQNILDVGCGSAWVAGHFCPKGIVVYSMDISTVNPVKALELYPFKHHFGIVADVFALPFPEGTFDCIIASEIIEHVPDPRGFLLHLLKVLRPGGVLIVTTPYNEKITYTLCIHCNQPTPLNAHLHSFTAGKLKSMLPASPVTSAKTTTFCNKVLIRLQTHILLQYLPFTIWRLLDRITNKLWYKPNRLLLHVIKQ